MHPIPKNLMVLVFVLAPCFVVFATDKPEGAQQWMAWTPTERAAFVAGYLDGHLHGRNQACKVADNWTEAIKRKHPSKGSHSSETAFDRCISLVGDYTKVKWDGSVLDVSAYTGVVTEFYEKYPQYRTIPHTYLMGHLNDREYKTADQLYEMARTGEIKTNW